MTHFREGGRGEMRINEASKTALGSGADRLGMLLRYVKGTRRQHEAVCSAVIFLIICRPISSPPPRSPTHPQSPEKWALAIGQHRENDEIC